jgi:hypothetical protein
MARPPTRPVLVRQRCRPFLILPVDNCGSQSLTLFSKITPMSHALPPPCRTPPDALCLSRRQISSAPAATSTRQPPKHNSAVSDGVSPFARQPACLLLDPLTVPEGTCSKHTHARRPSWILLHMPSFPRLLILLLLPHPILFPTLFVVPLQPIPLLLFGNVHSLNPPLFLATDLILSFILILPSTR